MKSIAYVGMDVHEDHVNVAALPELVGPGVKEMLDSAGIDTGIREERFLHQSRIGTTKDAVQRHFRALCKQYELRCCYEASQFGYVLHRWLAEIGVACEVIAPSKTPVRSGDRVKTDRRDARKLAQYLRGEELTAVHIPGEEEEGDRAFVRYRQTLSGDVTRLKNRVLKFLGRHGLRYREGRSSFSQAHWRYLRKQEFAGEEGFAYRECLTRLEYEESRLREADRHLVLLAGSDRYREQTGRMCCLRGIASVGAMVLQTETFDFRRFQKAHQLMGFYGFGVSEESSGHSRYQGGITKTGNTNCRFVLVEAAWHYRHKPGVSEGLKARWEGQPAEVVAHALRAQERLHDKFWRVAIATGCQQKAAVAVGRELSGFVWAIMTDHCGAPETGLASGEAGGPGGSGG